MTDGSSSSTVTPSEAKNPSTFHALGFTKSKVDSNLCSKVECERPVMLLLYVDDLFLRKKKGTH